MLGEINWTDAWPIISSVGSFLSMLICGMAMFIFNGFRNTLEKHDKDIAEINCYVAKYRLEQKTIEEHGDDIKDIKDRLSTCRKECDDERVDKNDYLREAGYNRRFQERQIADMAEIKTLVKTMPEITGQIIRAVMAEMKRGEQ